MSRICHPILLAFCLGFLSVTGLGQEKGGNRQSVLLRDPSRPAVVKVKLMNGSIRVRAYDGKDVIVETRSSNGSPTREARPNQDEERPQQKEPGARDLKVEQEDNLVSVSAGPMAGAVNLDLQVPVKSSLKLTCLQAGEIVVEKVEGEIEANGLNGSVRLLDVSGVVVAHTLNGQIQVTFQRVTPGKPMSFSTLNGDIDVTLPANTRATVKLETLNGSIHADFEIQPNGDSRQANAKGTTKPGSQSVWTTEQVRSGTINGGGPEFQFKAFNGTIHLRKKGN